MQIVAWYPVSFARRECTMQTQKGWLIKQTFDNDFVHIMEALYEKYGEEVFSIQGIANKHMDIVAFSKQFFGKSGNVADISIDGNANIKEKNILQYNYESGKAVMKLNSFYLLYKWVNKCFGEEVAAQAVEKVVNGELFVNDMNSFHMPYCFAFDLRNLLSQGMNFFKGNMTIRPPRRSESFIALIIQTTAYISNQIMGAASYPDFFVVLDWFYRKEFGADYTKTIRKGFEDKLAGKDTPEVAAWDKVKNQLQNFIYSMNFPFRGSQSAFTNLSVMDDGFMKTLFKDYKIPTSDGNFEDPDLHSSKELSKLFFEYFSHINCREGIFTFPVMTIAISVEKGGKPIDPEFCEWAAKANSEKGLANIFQSEPTSFSSCCRLKNDLTKVADTGYQNSFGVGGLSIGSHRVAGLNLPRIALLEKKDPDILEKDLEILHKILYAHRQLIKHLIELGNQPLYTAGWIHLARQYSTIGFIGAHEYVANKGMDIAKQDGLRAIREVLGLIEKKIVGWQEAEKEEKNIYNVEQIPGESMCVRLCEIDTLLRHNPNKYAMYSNQYIPLVQDASIYDRIRIQGKIDSHTSGGAILHINVDDNTSLSPKQFGSIMQLAREHGCTYFAINYAYSECTNGHYSVGKHEKCPACQEAIVCQYTRVVGFLTPVRSWSKTRREWEFPRRVFYRNGRLEDVHA